MIKTDFLAFLTIFLIEKIWKGKIGRFYNSKNNIMCRFHPSCSNYATLALKKHGFYKGIKMSINRINRCNLNNTDSCVDFP